MILIDNLNKLVSEERNDYVWLLIRISLNKHWLLEIDIIIE